MSKTMLLQVWRDELTKNVSENVRSGGGRDEVDYSDAYKTVQWGNSCILLQFIFVPSNIEKKMYRQMFF